MKLTTTCALALLGAAGTAYGRVIDFETDAGGIPDSKTLDTAWANGRLLNKTLASLESGDELLFQNKTYYTMGGIQADGLKDVVIRIEGTIEYSDDMKQWPRRQDDSVLECLSFTNAENVTFTSSNKGVFQGNGDTWWGIPGVGYLERTENRPRLFHMDTCKSVLVENIRFLQSPYWTFTANSMDGLEVLEQTVPFCFAQ